MGMKSFFGAGKEEEIFSMPNQARIYLWYSPTNALYDINNFLCKGNKSTHYIAMARLLKKNVVSHFYFIYFLKKRDEQERK